jgi:formiminotetrahydrofolate cyclodeaminase
MRHATDIPLETFRAALGLVPLGRVVADHGNPNAKSDASVAVQMAMTAGGAANANVEINLDGTGDALFARETRLALRAEMMEAAKLLAPIATALGWKGHEPPRPEARAPRLTSARA